jgi:DNA-binding HxlR family transcriptional regulator
LKQKKERGIKLDFIIQLLGKFFSVLSDPIKLQILQFLKRGELNSKEIKNKLKISQSYTSQQLKKLVTKDIIQYRRNKKGIKIYNIKYKGIYDILEMAQMFIKKIERNKYESLFSEIYDSKRKFS